VRLKILYWRAVESGDTAAVERIGRESRALAEALTGARRHE
jgi:hypothetical protein